MASHRTYTATLHHMVLQSVINTSTVHICYNFFFLRILLKVNVSIKSKWVTDVLSSEDIRKVENKGVRGEQCPSVLYLHIGCCSAVLLAVQRLRVCPGCDVCQWFCTFGLGSAPGYPPAGNCVPLSCLLLGLFWFFFFWFLFFSWCRLCWQPMTAGEKKKIKTQKEKTKNKTHVARNGEDPIVLEAHGIYFSLWIVLLRSAAGWLGELCSLCFLLLCTFLGSSLLGFWLCF